MIWFRPTSAPYATLPTIDRSSGHRVRSANVCRTGTLTVVSLGLVAGLVATRRQDLTAATEVLTTSAPLPFLVAVALGVTGVVNRAGQYRWAHEVAGIQTTVGAMLRISAAAYALNKVVKTGGIGGVALFVRHGRRRGQPTGSILAACAVNSVGSQVGMLVVTLLALGALIFGGSGSGTWALVAGAVVLLLAAGLVTAVVVGLRSRDLAERWYSVPFGLIGRAATWVGLSAPAAPDPANLDRFFQAVQTVRHDPRSSVPVLAHAVAGKLIGAAVLATALWAVGATIGPGPVLVVYVLALAAAATTILPGGLGAVEATMTLALTRYGVEAPVALAGTIIFRLLDLWVPVVIGSLAAPGLDQSAASTTPGLMEPPAPTGPGPLAQTAPSSMSVKPPGA